ncbi:unnamed protein product [Urochloa humidicola]
MHTVIYFMLLMVVLGRHPGASSLLLMIQMGSMGKPNIQSSSCIRVTGEVQGDDSTMLKLDQRASAYLERLWKVAFFFYLNCTHY